MPNTRIVPENAGDLDRLLDSIGPSVDTRTATEAMRHDVDRRIIEDLTRQVERAQARHAERDPLAMTGRQVTFAGMPVDSSLVDRLTTPQREALHAIRESGIQARINPALVLERQWRYLQEVTHQNEGRVHRQMPRVPSEANMWNHAPRPVSPRVPEPPPRQVMPTPVNPVVPIEPEAQAIAQGPTINANPTWDTVWDRVNVSGVSLTGSITNQTNAEAYITRAVTLDPARRRVIIERFRNCAITLDQLIDQVLQQASY